MNGADGLAVGITVAIAGALLMSATGGDPETTVRPLPPSTARRAWTTREGAAVRQAPTADAPVLGTLVRGREILVGGADASVGGYIPLVREWVVDEDGGSQARSSREIGWLAPADVTFMEPTAVTSSMMPGEVPVRTIGTHHSLAETRQILAVADYRFGEVGRAVAEALARPISPSDRAALEFDWNRLLETWRHDRQEIVRGLTLVRILVPFVSADAVPSEFEYGQILAFIQYQELVRGSLQDITRRVERILGRTVLFEAQPRQDAPDLDHDMFREIDAAIRYGEDKAQAAKNIATNPLTLGLGSILLVAGVGIVFLPEILLFTRAVR